ncbi:flagellar motor protein MotB [Paenarthrobacter sp. Z7-10]|uniref:OmpA/MotB family protein n=1 Tax=Paenarthrobacter sp. Z7-10 TaxID=2787635 RepID=UPI0022A9B73E|nr:flagellar motor protein MotB [Paenarthrobacter sp. Z7-10]MCZ2403309.1 flagellar motor protein MotB [Paenarthrobacter sp. Z7-10]
MSARPRKRSFAKPTEHHPDERWMASYMDMVTVLMCMFIVLYAMSTVDKTKFEILKNSLATGFGVTATTTVDTAMGVVVPPDKVSGKEKAFTDLQLAEKEVDKLTALREKMKANLKAKGLVSAVSFTIDERGLTVRLVSSETFFSPDDAQLTGESIQVLNAIAPVLSTIKLDVSVEGNAALIPDSGGDPLYWEISASRATNVVRHLIEVDGIAARRMAAVGFGAARPVGKTNSPADLAKNRRVDIVVLSDQAETIRSLIPQVMKARGQ